MATIAPARLRKARKHNKIRRALRTEPLENRLLLNADPVANDDEYTTAAGETLEVGSIGGGAGEFETLVPTGATWKYLDDGSNQDTAWRAPEFDDAAWASGPAELGYGDGDEATVVGYGPNPSNRFVTTYFRHEFNVDAAYGGTLMLRLKADDGAAVYLNGVEVVRENLSPGAAFDTFAAGVGDEHAFHAFSVDAAALASGRNVLAVEIHQVSAPSSDISFDFELNAPIEPTGPGEPSGVLLNDIDPDGDTLTAALVSPPSNGTVQLNENGSFTYTPVSGFSGSDSFTYRASDGTADSDPATVTIDVQAVVPVNHPPQANADDYRAEANEPLVAGGNANTGHTLVARGSVWNYLDDGSDQGAAWQAADFDDGAWASGPSQLGYGDGDEATTISFGNDPSNKFVTSYFRRAFNVDSPPEGTLTLHLLADDGAAVYLNGAEIVRQNLAPGVAFDAFAESVGDERAYHTYSIDAALLASGENVLAVEVHQVHASSSDVSFDLELSAGEPSSIPGVLANDFDADGDALTASLFAGPSHGTVELRADGGFTYTPADGFTGEDTFAYRASDGQASSNIATVSIVVGGSTANRSPVASDEQYELAVGAVDGVPTAILDVPASSGVLANDSDPDGDAISASLVAGPAFGQLELRPDGSFVYEMSPAATEGDQFTYVVVDEHGLASNVATATITFVPEVENRPPVANDDAYETVEGKILRAGLTQTLPGTSDTPLVSTGDAWKYLDDGSDQGVAWLAADFDDGGWASGPSQLGYGEGDEATTVGYGENPVDKFVTTYFRRAFHVDAPLDGTVALRLLADDGAAVYLNGTEVARQNLAPGAAFDTFAESVGEENVYAAYTIDVSLLASGENVLAVEVHQVHATSSDISFDLELLAGGSGDVPGVLANDVDADGDALTASLAAGPNHGSVELHSDGGFTYTPADGFTGEDTFTYRASDGHASSNIATVSIVVADPTDNPPPMAGDFNGDQAIDADDIDMLYAALRAAAVEDVGVQAAAAVEPSVSYDLTGDSVVDQRDVDTLIGTLLNTAFGDANLDGRVDLADLIRVRNRLGFAAGWANGDFDGDASATMSDAATLARNFGHTQFAPPPASAIVRHVAMNESRVAAPTRVDLALSTISSTSRRTAHDDGERSTLSIVRRRTAARTSSRAAADAVSTDAALLQVIRFLSANRRKLSTTDVARASPF